MAKKKKIEILKYTQTDGLTPEILDYLDKIADKINEIIERLND